MMFILYYHFLCSKVCIINVKFETIFDYFRFINEICFIIIEKMRVIIKGITFEFLKDT